MRTLWRAQTRHVAVWWTFLAVAGATNILLWCLLYSAHASRLTRIDSTLTMFLLSAAYVFGCAFRSFLPRADVQRICLFDTWLSSVVIGRSVATIAEVSFAAQWALMLHMLGDFADLPAVSAVALVIVPMLVVAQACSWYGVLTTNYRANAIENSIWAVTFGLIGLALLQLAPHFSGVVFLAIVVTLVGISLYLAFLALVDVPMYVSRSRASTTPSLSLAEGLRDATRRWIVTHDVAHWRQEIPWMSLYFTAAVWGSLLLCGGYALRHHLPESRVEASHQAGHERQPVSVRLQTSKPGLY